MDISQVDVPTIREAARAWRNSDVRVAMHRNASGWLRWMIPEPNMSLYDRIDDLVDEIDRLRTALDEGELSDTICRVAGQIGACNCPGDENGADTKRAMCMKLAVAIRASAGIAADVGETAP